MVTNIHDGVNTTLSLKKEFLSGNKSEKILKELSKKCELNASLSLCSDIYEEIIKKNRKFDTVDVFKAELYFAQEKLSSDIIMPVFDIIEKYQDDEFVKDAYMLMIQYYKGNSEVEEEANLFKELSEKYLNDPSILNSYAWRMSQLNKNLVDATQKADKAIDLCGEKLSLKSMILDTKAELLWIQGDIDGAIEAIQIAIEIDPKSNYFQEQLNKFYASKKES